MPTMLISCKLQLMVDELIMTTLRRYIDPNLVRKRNKETCMFDALSTFCADS